MDESIFHKAIDESGGRSNGWEKGWRTPGVMMQTEGWAGHKIRAKFTAHYIEGNSAPYISVTADVRDKHGREAAGGCMHEEIEAAFPDLKPLIMLHLCSTEDGRPSHLIDNACYWAEAAAGISKWSFKQTPEELAKILWEHFHGGLIKDDAAHFAGLFAPIKVSPPDWVIFEQWADSEDGKAAKRQVMRERIEEFCSIRGEAMKANMDRALADFRIEVE